jgi:GNAT superfamily N-acetyltransferase
VSISVPEGFSFGALNGCLNLPELAAGIQTERWQQAFTPPSTPKFDPPLTGDNLLLALTHSAGNPRAMRVYVKRNLDVKYCLVINRGDIPLAVARREMRLKRHEAFHNMLVVNPAAQQAGLSSQLLANAIPLYRDLNIRCIQLDAGLTAGGSVWPKFGFQPVTTEEWRKTHSRIRKNLAQIDGGVRSSYHLNYGKDLFQVVDSILDTPTPNSIWAISDLDLIMPAISGSRGLGSYLLSKTRWRGILHFDDPLAYGRLVTYLRRKGHVL